MGTSSLTRHGYITPCYNLYMGSSPETSALYTIHTADNEDTCIMIQVDKSGKSMTKYSGEYLASQGIIGLVPDYFYRICVDGANVSFEIEQ